MTVEEMLNVKGYYTSTTSGVSMFPLIRNRKDNIVVSKVDRRLKKYEIALYKIGEKYVLHRVVKVLPEGYIIRGDNCMRNEYGITDKDVLGVLTEFYRSGKKINLEGFGYKTYIFFNMLSYPFRYPYYLAKLTAKRIYKRLFLSRVK